MGLKDACGLPCRDFKCLTLDVIASTVFSYDTDVFNKDESVFLEKLTVVFNSFDPALTDTIGKLRLLVAGEIQ